jgi:glucokinase
MNHITSTVKNVESATMLLAGDIGGTKTLLGLFEQGAAGDRPRPVLIREFGTLDFDSFEEIVDEFFGVRDGAAATPIDAMCVGVAGPVNGLVARLTNVPWMVNLGLLARRVGRARLKLLNDLEAMAYGVAFLEPDEIAVLQEGIANPRGNAALIAAGTGLGEALLHNVNGRFVPSPSEGGHADFSPRNRRELDLMSFMMRERGRVEVESCLSGPGLVNLYRFVHGSERAARASHASGAGRWGPASERAGESEGRSPSGDYDIGCDGVRDGSDIADAPAQITQAALTSQCERCVETLNLFVDLYGSEAGNLALRSVATAGIYVGGGIAPKILPALETGRFLEAFRDKPPMSDLLATIPIRVILNEQAGLVGASVHAAQLASAAHS